jgi:hypothetical protein
VAALAEECESSVHVIKAIQWAAWSGLCSRTAATPPPSVACSLPASRSPGRTASLRGWRRLQASLHDCFPPGRKEAEARFLRVSGLEGLVGADASVIAASIVQDGDGYRLAADPRTVLVAVTGRSAEDAWRASTVPRRLACGSRDEPGDARRDAGAGPGRDRTRRHGA